MGHELSTVYTSTVLPKVRILTSIPSSDAEVAFNGEKSEDLLDDSKFWTIPDRDYTMSEVDQWGVYKSQDKHLLSSPPQGACFHCFTH